MDGAMSGAWAGLGQDEGVRTVSRRVRFVALREGEEAKLQVCREAWAAEGMQGTAYIFLEEQVAELSDDVVLAVARRLRGGGTELGQPTVSRGAEGFVFVTYVDFIDD